MTYSTLVSKVISSPNHSGPRNRSISKITIHHMAGNLSIESCGQVFANPARKASANYGIGSDGRIANFVPEEYRAWTSSSPSNDNQAITIEVANSQVGGQWPISEAAYKSLIMLCADICRRYNIHPRFTGTPDGSITVHRMFAATSCPGPTLYNLISSHQVEEDIDRELGVSHAITTQQTTDLNSLVQATLLGKYGNGEVRKKLLGSNYEAVQAAINAKFTEPAVQHTSVNIDAIARRVIAGEFGNGPARARALANAGYDNVAVQNRVNEILTGIVMSGITKAFGSNQNSSANIDALARKVIAGEFGNGDSRKKALGSNYEAVQRRVNELLK